MIFLSWLTLGLSLAVTQASSVADVKARIDAINASRETSVASKTREISTIYLSRSSSLQARLSELSDSDLHDLFNITSSAFFYSQFFDRQHREDFFVDLMRDYDALDRRAIVTDAESAEVYQGLVSSRDFSKANEMRERHPKLNLPKLPSISAERPREADRPALYRLDPDGRNLRLHSIDLLHGEVVVIVAQCHFARDAALQIARDPVLLDAFKRGNAVWLESSTSPLSAEDLKEWNDFFPDLTLGIAYDDKDWPDVDFSASPGFFFFKDGKLVSRRDGWSSKTTKGDLTQSLRELGLLK